MYTCPLNRKTTNLLDTIGLVTFVTNSISFGFKSSNVLYCMYWRKLLMLGISSNVYISKNGATKKRKKSRGIGRRNLVSKNQLLSSKIASCSPQTDTHSQRKQNLETLFSAIPFINFFGLSLKIRTGAKTKAF